MRPHQKIGDNRSCRSATALRRKESTFLKPSRSAVRRMTVISPCELDSAGESVMKRRALKYRARRRRASPIEAVRPLSASTQAPVGRIASMVISRFNMLCALRSTLSCYRRSRLIIHAKCGARYHVRNSSAPRIIINYSRIDSSLVHRVADAGRLKIRISISPAHDHHQKTRPHGLITICRTVTYLPPEMKTAEQYGGRRSVAVTP